MLPTASRLKSHLPKILLRRGRIFLPVPCSRPAFCVARSPERPPAPKSYCATVGFFCLRSAPTLQSSPAKESQPLKKSLPQKILLRCGRNLWPVFCSSSTKRPSPQERSRDARSAQPSPWRSRLRRNPFTTWWRNPFSRWWEFPWPAWPATFFVHICEAPSPKARVPTLPGWGVGLPLSTMACLYT